MKVLQIVGGLPSQTNPSFQPFVASQIRSLVNAGLDVDILDLSTIARRGLKKYLSGAVELRRRIASANYDVIHAHYSYCGWVARCQRQHPVVVSLMGSDLLGTPDMEGKMKVRGQVDTNIARLLTQWVDHVIVKSDEMAQHLPPRVKVSVLPNGVDFERFKPMDKTLARARFNLSMDEKIVLFAADPHNSRKNYRLANGTVEMLQDRFRQPCRLWAFYKQNQEELPYAMNAADLLLMTSYWEGSPNIVKEAMACNLPVVSVKVGDVPRVLAGASNCHLAGYDALELASRAAVVLRTGGRSDGRDHIQHLSLEKVARQIIDIYQQELRDFNG
ncbi:glycosyltransferase [Geotalea sp. SG265]|uniref:glycosyltransferase n=1 Tax=Geotalea sp. SG265 TaxID=2922867 RepID=UPI001FAFC888|nr:glycosyltransferase [Geotalea sp. SG265]